MVVWDSVNRSGSGVNWGRCVVAAGRSMVNWCWRAERAKRVGGCAVDGGWNTVMAASTAE